MIAAIYAHMSHAAPSLRGLRPGRLELGRGSTFTFTLPLRGIK